MIRKIDDAHIRRLDVSLLLLFRELMHHRRTTVFSGGLPTVALRGHHRPSPDVKTSKACA